MSKQAKIWSGLAAVMRVSRTDGLPVRDPAVTTNARTGEQLVRLENLVGFIAFAERQGVVTVAAPEPGVPYWSCEIEKGPEADEEDL